MLCVLLLQYKKHKMSEMFNNSLQYTCAHTHAQTMFNFQQAAKHSCFTFYYSTLKIIVMGNFLKAFFYGISAVKTGCLIHFLNGVCFMHISFNIPQNWWGGNCIPLFIGKKLRHRNVK